MSLATLIEVCIAMLNLTFADWHSTFSYYELFVVIKVKAKPVVPPTPTDKYAVAPR